jgi:hypothetical protein
MTGEQIIDKFHIYTGDQSELSSQEELDLLNNVYQNVMQDRPWEFLKKTVSGSIQTDGITSWITLPYDFRFFIENNEKTDNSSTSYNNASPKVVFIGPNYTPIQIVNFSDRRQFRNTSGFAYPDIVNQKLVFTWLPTETTYEFDYIYQWAELTLTSSPIFPADFHNMLYQLMAVDSVIINLFDRSHSYAAENQKGADKLFKALCYWNSLQTFN